METVFEIFNNYGWGGIAGLAAIGVIFLIIKYFNNKLTDDVKDGMAEISDKMTTEMSKTNSELITAIHKTNEQLIDHIIHQDQKKQDDHTEKYDQRMDVTNEINSKLKEIALYYNSYRACIFEFHNSSQNLLGVPFAKYSCNFESPGKVSGSQWMPLITLCQNMPFATISNIYSKLSKEDNGQLVYNNCMEDNSEFFNDCPVLYSLMTNVPNVKHIVYIALYDNNRKMIGILCLEYHCDIPSHLEMNQLEIESAQLSSILNLRYKFN